MMQGEVGPSVLKQGAQEDKGDTARLQYFVGAIAVGDLVKSTLGPKGLDKILLPMQVDAARREKPTVTNDGATILKSVWLENPAAKILADLALQQDMVCGDGTTGVVVLAAELLREAEQLVEKNIHPQEHFARIAVDAVMRLKENAASLDLIHILKKPGGTLRDSYLDDGFILEKRIGTIELQAPAECSSLSHKLAIARFLVVVFFPSQCVLMVWERSVMVANTPMDTDKIKIFGARVKVDSFEAVHQLELAEKEKMKQKVDKILAYNCDVFINRQLIYNYPDQLFKAAGVAAIEHSDFDGMERLAAALGAEIVSTFDAPSDAPLGFCAKMEEKEVIGSRKFLNFFAAGLASEVSKEQQLLLVCGAGAAEMAMEAAVSDLAKKVPGKESLAVESFARALRQIPTIILDNAGLDSAEIVSQLRAQHHEGQHTMGVDVQGDGGTIDVKQLGVLEAFKSKLSQLCFATEAAEMIIRVDDIIRCAPRERSGM
ncbi:t-complex protein beta subunit [Cyclospora cayetanensis]|uniref:T-complex protein beta subunit n=1 Tax=Cyclospora cayetanensis TaxID=88456 RepID=A0A1D3D4R9_9EIME|nr:t-complex protein beta subunit [Cyclospora cayetanensis]